MRHQTHKETLLRKIQRMWSKWAEAYFYTETLRRFNGQIYKRCYWKYVGGDHISAGVWVIRILFIIFEYLHWFLSIKYHDLVFIKIVAS